MPTTTNFGWTTPADTDLVKDGAAAIRTLAGNIDTSLVDLKGGTSGQYLAKNSNTDLDYVWSTLPAAGGLTLISSTTLSAVSSLSLSGISGSYKHLYLEWFGVAHSGANNVFGMRFNNDSSGLYSSALANIDQSTAASGLELNQTSMNWDEHQPFGNNANSTDATKTVNGSMIIYDYSSTSLLKRFYSTVHFFNVGASANRNTFVQGVYGSTSAITEINVFRVAGSGTLSNNADTAVRLWGMS
jgi:hypothetical protein